MLDDVRAAEAVGVSATPTFLINGQVLSGAQPLEAFKAVIDAELAVEHLTSTNSIETLQMTQGLR